MTAISIKDLKEGDYFTLRPIEFPKESQVYVRGHYERSLKKFSVTKFSDTSSERFLRGNCLVYVGFFF